MGFELVAVGVEEVERRTFAAVIAPFADVVGSKAFDE